MRASLPPTLLALIPVLACGGGSSPPAAVPEQADLVLRAGRIVTVDDARPEAEALAVRDGPRR